MPVYFDKSKERWRFTFNRKIRGQRTRYTKLLPKGWIRGRAEAFERFETARLYAQATGLENPAPKIQHAVALYVEHRIPNMRSGRGIGLVLVKCLPWYEDKGFDDLADVARDYVRDNPNLAPASIRNHMTYVRSACRYAWKHHKMGKARPGDDMHLPQPDNERQMYLDGPALANLWKSFDDPEARDLFRLAFFSGLRWISELLPRQAEDVIRDNGIWLRVPTTKNKAPRMVPIVPDAAPLLKRLPFPGSHRFYYNAFMRARDKAGCPELVAHDLRHCLASAIISGQGNLSDVGEALGHANLSSSKRYAHLYPGHLRDVLKKVAAQMHTKPVRKAAKK